MADKNVTVTTISELVENFDYAKCEDDSNLNITVDAKDKTLDFNDEGYFYHPTHFLSAELNYALIGGGANADSVRTINIDFNNTRLTNIYLYPDCYFINLSTSTNNDYASATMASLNIQNATFEIVSNKGRILNTSYLLNASLKNWNKTSNIVFKNCVFNIKVLDFDYLFINNSKTFHFINCVFNIEIIAEAQTVNKIIYYSYCNASVNAEFKILSCEFRIRDKTTTAFQTNFDTSISSSSNSIITCDNGLTKSYILDNVFFIDNLSDAGKYYSLIHQITSYNGNYLTCINNFISSLLSSSPVILGAALSSSSYSTKNFIDSSKITIEEKSDFFRSSVLNLTGLPTEDCKNAEKLVEAGYVFAAES